MIHPSYNELFNAINKDEEGNEKPLVSSRYSVCIATAKRARQLIDGAEPLATGSKCDKPLSIAVDELYQGKVQVLGDDDVDAGFSSSDENFYGEDSLGQE